jgi:hypothetical protein
MTLKNPAMPTKNLQRRNLAKKSLIISWRTYKTWLTKIYKMHSRNFQTPKIKNMRRHRNK